MKAHSIVLGVATVLTLHAMPARADDSAELGLAYAKAQQENLDEMKKYRWNTHTTLKSGGETKFDFTVSNRLNEKGEMVQEVEEADSNVRRKRGLRGRRQQQAVAELDELLDEIVGTMASYAFMTKGQEVDFFDRAEITEGDGDMEGMRVVRATDVSVDGDTVVKTIDPETLHPGKIEFQFQIEGHSVEGEVLYRPIEDGPNVPRFSTIRVLDMDGLIETEFLDYSKQL